MSSVTKRWWPLAFPRCLLLTFVLLGLWLVAAEPDLAPGLTVEPLALSPSFMRCVVAPGEVRIIEATIRSARPTTILSMETACRCVMVLDSFPAELSPEKPFTVHLRVVGVLPGIKTITLHTTTGSITSQLQVVSAGVGLGKDSVERVLAHAEQNHAAVWFLLKDLHGAIRNCGCSDGALGGIEHLAAFPSWCQTVAPRVATRFLHIGDMDGMRTGVARMLDGHGWSPAGSDCILSSHPAEDVQRFDVIAVIPCVPTAINHAKIVRVPLDGGMILVALSIIDGRIVAQDDIPVDRSLPRDDQVLPPFATSLSVHVHEDVDLSQSCVACHQAAAGSWHHSAHAHALQALLPADRTDECIACHATPLTARDVAGGVQCQSCHQNSQRHLASHGTQSSMVTRSCQSCHNERAHPDFVRDDAWARIAHGR